MQGDDDLVMLVLLIMMEKLLIEPKEAELVQLIYSKYLSGQWYRSIANELNKRGYQPIKGTLFFNYYH